MFAVAAVAIYAIFVHRAELVSSPASECNPAELAAASAAGTEAASGVALTRPGSMERQNAILAIRARETEIRHAGFPTAADSFAAAAERRLKADRIIR